MQSSYNIIKNNYVIAQGNKEIITEFEKKIDNIVCNENPKIDDIELENDKRYIEEQKALVNKLIEDANSHCETIIANARETAKNIEKDAFEAGHRAGYTEGNQLGYKEAYEQTLLSAKAEADDIIRKANELLLNAKVEYEEYLEEKKEEIILLSINMAETVLRKELASKDGLNELILEVLQNSRNTETVIIRANAMHCDEIKLHLDEWKSNLVLRGELFVVQDESLGQYDAVIEKNNGRVEIGLKNGIDGIKQAIL